MSSPSTFHFERLPLELLLGIARRLPNLDSLHALASAVPSVFRLLDRYGGELLQAITSSPSAPWHSPLATVPQVRDMIHVIVLARTSALPAWTVAEFVRSFLHPTMVLKTPPQEPCVPPVPSELPFSVLVTAQRVRDWSQACLAHHLQQLRDAQPRLRRPADPDFSYTRGYGPDNAMVPGWQRQCEGVPYKTPAMAPASWVEEQVVVRAFWRLQMLLDLQSAAKEGRLGGWPDGDVRQISTMKLEEVLGQTGPLDTQASPLVAQYQELFTVAEYLQDQIGHVSVPGLPAIADPMPHRIPETVPEATDPNDPRLLSSPHWYLSHGLYVRPGIDLTFASVLQSKQSPVWGVSARIFRRLGLTIWERSRLALLGLEEAPVSRTRGLSREGFDKPCSYFWFQWRSLLRPDELSLVEKELARKSEAGERD